MEYLFEIVLSKKIETVVKKSDSGVEKKCQKQ